MGVPSRSISLARDLFDGAEDQLFFQSIGTDTEQEQRDGIVETLAVGLARFSTLAGLRGVVSIEGTPASGLDPTARVVSAQEVDDPWNLWVFRLGGSGNVSGESTRETVRVSWNASASRITPEWKLSFGGRGNFNRQENRAERLHDLCLRTDRLVLEQPGRIPRSPNIGRSDSTPGSRGRRGRIRSCRSTSARASSGATFRTKKPPGEPSRRSMRSARGNWDYEEETFFGELSETRFAQSLGIEFSQRQQWGDASVKLEGSQFLHDLELNRVELEGDISFRIFRGLSINAAAKILRRQRPDLPLGGRGFGRRDPAPAPEPRDR